MHKINEQRLSHDAQLDPLNTRANRGLFHVAGGDKSKLHKDQVYSLMLDA
jgi:hypothetical protein